MIQLSERTRSFYYWICDYIESCACNDCICKYRQEVAADLRLIYEAANEDKAREGFVRFEQKWGSIYPYICTM